MLVVKGQDLGRKKEAHPARVLGFGGLGSCGSGFRVDGGGSTMTATAPVQC